MTTVKDPQKKPQKEGRLSRKAGKALKAQDDLCPNIRDELHLDNDECQKTHIGGVLSFCAQFLIFALFVSGMQKMVTRYKPYIQSIAVEVPLQNQHFSIKDLNHIHYSILDHKDRYFTLEETLPYIDIRLELTRFSYTDDENGFQEHKNVTKSRLENCQGKHFNYTKDEQTYWKLTILRQNHSVLCLKDETKDWTIEGNIQFRKMYSLTNSFMKLDIFRCQNNTDDPNATVCASTAEIERWLLNKQLEPLCFNKQVSLKDYENEYRIKFDQYEAIPFKAGYKSDLWFRYRQNIYERKDYWYWPYRQISKFPSFYLTYRNWIQVPPEDYETEKLVRILYRNDELQMEHEREVIQAEDFLGSIAGMYDLIMFAIAFMFGQYIDFLTKVKWIKNLYRFQEVTEDEYGEEDEFQYDLAFEGGQSQNRTKSKQDKKLKKKLKSNVLSRSEANHKGRWSLQMTPTSHGVELSSPTKSIEQQSEKSSNLKINVFMKEEGKGADGAILDLTKINPFFFYIRNVSIFRFLLCCFKKSEKEKREKMLISRGTGQLREDFNFRNIMDRNRLSRFETKQLAAEGYVDYQYFEKEQQVKIKEATANLEQKIKDEIQQEVRKMMFGEKVLRTQNTFKDFENTSSVRNSMASKLQQQMLAANHGKRTQSSIGGSSVGWSPTKGQELMDSSPQKTEMDLQCIEELDTERVEELETDRPMATQESRDWKVGSATVPKNNDLELKTKIVKMPQ